MSDLHLALFGSPAWEPRLPSRAEVVTTIDCTCGGRLALMHRAAGRTRVWVGGYRHTRKGTADLLRDAALEDVEHLLRAEDVAGVTAVSDFLTVSLEALSELVPPLVIAARDLDVTGIAAHYAAKRAADPTVIHLPAGFLAECRDCGTVRDLAQTVLELEPLPNPPRRCTFAAGPIPVGMPSQTYDWPEGGRARRVALYRQLSAVLAS